MKNPLTRPRVRPPSPARGEGKCLDQPSPLAGEGGGLRPPGEGEAAHATRLNRARDLRGNMTDAEHALWRILRNRQFGRNKFRRQVPIGPYITDFVCFEARLVIEAYGGQHNESNSDRVRDAWLTAHGLSRAPALEQRDSYEPRGRRDFDSDSLFSTASHRNTPHPAALRPPSPARGGV